MISAGKYKVEGNPYPPLDAEARGCMQSRVDDDYGTFTKGAARGRGVPIWVRGSKDWIDPNLAIREQVLRHTGSARASKMGTSRVDGVRV